METDKIQITLAAARVNAGLTQDEVARDLKISKQTVINWEKGRVEVPFLALKILSDMYNIPIDYIILPTKST